MKYLLAKILNWGAMSGDFLFKLRVWATLFFMFHPTSAMAQEKINPEDLLRLEEEVTLSFRNNVVAVGKLDPYQDLLKKVQAYLQEHNIESKIVVSSGDLAFSTLIIKPGNQSPLNEFAQQAMAYGFQVKYFGPEEIRGNKLLGVFPKKKFLMLGAKALQDIPRFLQDPTTKSYLDLLPLLGQEPLEFLSSANVRLNQAKLLPRSSDPATPEISLTLDPKIPVILSRETYSQEFYYYLDLFQKSLALYHSGKDALAQIKAHPAQRASILDGINHHFSVLRSVLTNRLLDLHAILYVMIKHPAQVRFMYLPERQQIKLYVTPDLHYPTMIFKLKLAWPLKRPPQDVTEVLQAPTFQAIYRYVVAIAQLLASDVAAMRDRQQLTDDQLAALASSWENFYDLPRTTLAAAEEYQWNNAKIMRVLQDEQPFLLSFLHQRTIYRSRTPLPRPTISFSAQLAQMEHQLKADLKKATNYPEKTKAQMAFLNKIGDILKQQGIAYQLHSKDNFTWLEIIPGEQSQLNRLALEFKQFGFAFQYQGLRWIQEKETTDHFLRINFIKRRINFGATALGDLAAFFASSEVQALRAILPRLMSGKLPFLDNPILTSVGQPLAQNLPDHPWLDVGMILNKQIPVVILNRQSSMINFTQFFQQSVAFSYLGKAVLAEMQQHGKAAHQSFVYLRNAHFNLLFSLAGHLVDFHTMIYLLLNNPTQITIQRNPYHLKVYALPDPANPNFQFELELPWPRQAAVPRDAGELLKASVLRELYRYHHELFMIMYQTKDLIRPLYTKSLETLTQAVPAWQPLETLPEKIMATAPAQPWHKQDWLRQVINNQPLPFNYIQELYLYHRQHLQDAINCGQNFAKTKNTSLTDTNF